METKNQNYRKNMHTIHEFAVPWRPYHFKRNTILIDGNIVKVYSGKYSHRGIILETEPAEACFEGTDLRITSGDGTIIRIADDGWWDPGYVNGSLVIRGCEVMVGGKSSGDSLIIRCDEPVLNAQWMVYGGRHVIWVALAKEGRFFSSPGFYDYAATYGELSEEMDEMLAGSGFTKATPEQKPPEPDKQVYQVRFWPGIGKG